MPVLEVNSNGCTADSVTYFTSYFCKSHMNSMIVSSFSIPLTVMASPVPCRSYIHTLLLKQMYTSEDDIL